MVAFHGAIACYRMCFLFDTHNGCGSSCWFVYSCYIRCLETFWCHKPRLHSLWNSSTFWASWCYVICDKQHELANASGIRDVERMPSGWYLLLFYSWLRYLNEQNKITLFLFGMCELDIAMTSCIMLNERYPLLQLKPCTLRDLLLSYVSNCSNVKY